MALACVSVTVGFFTVLSTSTQGNVFEDDTLTARRRPVQPLDKLTKPLHSTLGAGETEQDVVFVTPCEDSSQQLCRYVGLSTRFPILEHEFAGPELSCWRHVHGGVSLRSLSLKVTRVVVFPHVKSLNFTSHELDQISRVLRQLPHAVVCQSESENEATDTWLSDYCYSVEPAKHIGLFEYACSKNSNTSASSENNLLNFLETIRFGVARFPKHMFRFHEDSVHLNDVHTSNPEDEHKKYAYVTFLSSSTHDWYVESVRMLWHGLKTLCDVHHEFVVMILSPDARSKEGVMQYAKQLSTEGMIVRFVHDINTRANRPGRFVGIWGKQSFWNLTEYMKVVFFDPDQVMLRCPNSVFTYPAWSHAAVGRTFNSGIMVAEPNASIMLDVQLRVARGDVDNDQSLTETYFNGRGFVIPEYWSFWKRREYLNSEEWQAWKDCSAFFHFTGEKPWESVVAGTEAGVHTFFRKYEDFKKDNVAGPTLHWAKTAIVDIPGEVGEHLEFVSCP